MDLKDLGLTQEQLAERVVETIADSLLTGRYGDDSDFSEELRGMIRTRIDARIIEIAETHVLPKVDAMVENLSIQGTNHYGEPKGEPMTFVEYLTHKAEQFIAEKVNSSGESKAESGSYSFSGAQTRIAYMIHKHLHYEISRAMKAVIGDANKTLVDGITETCKIQLGEIAKKLTINVTVPR